MCTINVHSPYNSATAMTTLTLGVILQAVALHSSTWSLGVAAQVSKGLFSYCYDDLCFKVPNSMRSEAHEATQVLASMGLSLGCLALLLAPLHMVQSVLIIHFGQTIHRLLAFITVVVSAGSCVFIFLAIVVWVFGVHDSDTFSIGQGLVFSICGGVLIPMGALATRRAALSQYPPR